MPNHITNKLTIVGHPRDVEDVFDFIKIDYDASHPNESGAGTIDFNKITPMPAWVYGSKSDIIGITADDEQTYGAENCVLGWSRINWGTKWNAYGQPSMRNNENTIYFETAWNGVPSLMQKIAWMFPDVTVEYGHASEDFGANVAAHKFKGTDVLMQYIPSNGSKEAYELAKEIKGELPDWLEFDESINNYKEKDDEDEI